MAKQTTPQGSPATNVTTVQPAAEAAGSALMVIDYGEDAGAGLQDVGRDEIKIPTFRILQALSPQCQPVEAGGIEGAKPGMIYNTVTGEMYDGKEGLPFIPVDRDHNYVEFVPRDAGGGFVAIHDPLEPHILDKRDVQGKFGKLTGYSEELKKPTEIVETRYLYGLVGTDDDTVQAGVVQFTSSQITKYQSFMTRYMSIKYPNNAGVKIVPPLWAHKWRLRTVYQTGKKGSFYGWLIVLDTEPPLASRMRLDNPLYIQAKAFYELLKSGAASIDRDADSKAAEPSEGTAAAGGPDDDIPF